MLKRYIDEQTIEDVPRNGIITIEDTDDKGEVITRTTALSNLPLRLEKDHSLANKNGYYEYHEEEMPEVNDTDILLCRYVLKDNKITKVWTVADE